MNLHRRDPDSLDFFERALASLEHEHNQLRSDFHAHAELPVHAGFVTLLEDMRDSLKALQARWILVGSWVIGLLIGILLALLGVLWAMVRPAAPVTMPATPRLVCSQFSSQADAQAFYRANPASGRPLDGDADGLACEDLPAPRDGVPVSR